MDLPAVQLLLLEQGDHSLEDHTRDFLDPACFTYYPDHSLCIFYETGLSEQLKACLPINGPRGSFAEYVEWVLAVFGLPFTVCLTGEDPASPTPPPETSQPSSRCTEQLPEPTADGELEPAVTREPAGEPVTELIIASRTSRLVWPSAWTGNTVRPRGTLVLRWSCIVVVVSCVRQCFALGFIIKHSILDYPFAVCFIPTYLW